MKVYALRAAAPLIIMALALFAAPRVARPLAPAAAPASYLLALTDAPLCRASAADYNVATNVLFNVKATYFLKAGGEADANGLIPAEYDGISGFFPASAAERVALTPKYLYAAAELTTNAVSQISLYAAPDHDSEELTVIPKRATLKYYGGVTGAEAITGLGGLWLYAEYGEADGRVFGYVYAPLTAYSPIPENTIEYLPEPSPPPANTEPVNIWVQIGLIALFSIPALVIVYVIFRVPKSPRARRYYRDSYDSPDPDRSRTPKYLD